MVYYSDYRAGKVANGSHLTGELEFYAVTTLVPLAAEQVNSEEPSAGDNLRVLVDVLSQHGQPVIQSVSAEEKDVAGLGFGSAVSGKKMVYTYKFSVEQPCVWGVDEAATVAAIEGALDGVKVPFGDEGFVATDAAKKNVVVSYAKVL